MKLTLRARWSRLAHLFKAATQQHHRELIPVLAPFVPRDAVVFDIGAHAGQFAKLFARLAPDGHVYAFEPSEYARSVLTPALAFNRLSNVTVIPLGLSETAGEAVLHTPVKRSGGMGFGLAHLGGEATVGEAMVDLPIALTTLDTVVAERNIERLDFIKADIEGWEVDALSGGRAALARFRPALLLEVDDKILARAGRTPADLWALLAPLGYEACKAPGFETVGGYTGAGDYLFVAG